MELYNTNTFLPGAEARKKYWLDSNDMLSLDYQTPPGHGFGMGRPTHYFRVEEVKALAEEKYGKAGLQKKVASREKRKLNALKNEQKREKTKKKKLEEKENVLTEANVDKGPDLTDLGSFVAFANQCDQNQLKQTIVMLARDRPDVIPVVNRNRGVSMLDENSFKKLEARLSKEMTADPSEAFEKAAKKKKKSLDNLNARKTLNGKAGGKWTLIVTKPDSHKGLKGSLELEFLNEEYGIIEGLIEIDDNFGDFDGFKGKSSLSDKTMIFETHCRAMKKNYKGTCRITMKTASNGKLQMTGKFFSGLRFPGFASSFDFTGTKKGEEDEEEEEGDST